MTELAREGCTACRVGAPSVTEREMAELRPQIPEWQLIEEEGIRKLQRQFPFPNFVRALEMTRRVGELSEAEGHHPRIVTEWGKVTITWWTHKIRDLHRNDFIMAAKTDAVYAELAASDAVP